MPRHRPTSATLRLVQALIDANKMFDLVVVPNGDHDTGRTNGPVEYCRRRQYDFFVRHLLGAEPPDWNLVLAGPIPQ